MIVEMIGYLGSVLVVVAMLMSSVVKLRVINSIGAVIFAVYALLIHSYPTALMNICLVMINIYNLLKLRKKDQHFELINGKTEDTFLKYFLNYYEEDIETYFPEWKSAAEKADVIYSVCCDAVPAGILIGKTKENGTLKIVIDYSTPTYRDCSVGKYLYSKLSIKGVRKLVFDRNAGKHESYLLKMGFVCEEDIYVKELN